MMERAPDFLDSYYAFMNATGPKKQRKCWGKGRSDGGCRSYYEYRMRMNARFCAQADLANEMVGCCFSAGEGSCWCNAVL